MKVLAVIATLVVPAVVSSPATAAAKAALPDPTARGPYGHQVIDEAKFGLAGIQEPNSDGAAPAAGTAQAPEQVEIRGRT
jgi:hypothetical protein